MPLSEHEQNLLSQLEQQLQADDPKFASTMRGNPITGGGRRLAIGALAILLGLALIVVAVLFAQQSQIVMWVAAPAGFLVMLFGANYAFSPGKKGPKGVVDSDGSTRPRPTKSREGLMNRLEQRWDSRREQDGH